MALAAKTLWFESILDRFEWIPESKPESRLEATNPAARNAKSLE
jgi:hypothetical protein